MNRVGQRSARVCMLLFSALALALLPRTGQAQETVSPHGSLRSGIECSACHTTAGWRSVRERLDFDHDRQTRFALTGRHADASCSGCHLKLRFDQPRLAARECASCHLDVHQGRLSADCASCHNTQSFREAASIEQHARTRFPLTGAHIQISCESCHKDDRGGAWTALDTDCWSCHRGNYAAAKTVDHEGAGMAHDCTTCHGTAAWQTATFDHATVARGFTLDGRHATMQCAACHGGPGGSLKWTPSGVTDCVACHRGDYDREHAGTGYPANCERCHNTNGWSGADFNHAGGANGFDLQGRHANLLCPACHTPPDFALKWAKPAGTNDCVTCHRPEYDREHAGTGYPTMCLACHDVNDWARAVFDHVLGGEGFPLLGAHASAPCTSCHGPNNALKFPQPANADDCIACHRADYDAEHTGSGFPTTCLDCHNTTSFQGAVLNHDADFFPIYSGSHSGKWSNCQQCHPSATDFAVFTCLSCHEHSKISMDSKHAGRTGYAYDSVTCLSCHPRGKS